MGFHWQRDDSRDCLPAERICLLPDKGNWSVGYSCSAVVSVAVTCKEEWSLNIKKSKIKTEPHWSHCLCFSFCIHGTSIFFKNCTFSTPPPTSHCTSSNNFSGVSSVITKLRSKMLDKNIWHWTIRNEDVVCYSLIKVSNIKCPTIHEIANKNSCVVSYLLLANKWILKFKFTEILSSSYFCG